MREWPWCGAVISLDKGRNADEARSSQREDTKQRKGDEAGLSNPVVFGEKQRTYDDTRNFFNNAVHVLMSDDQYYF
ncbi:hypothetical protein DVH24_028222 [Malus domestica]|uniref:Uncharacterized protein n=1 Tax=Malus domestica TaxID=3750 RepID=A0A498HF40_MALDO|nr:hypothetical protein DVH24_028222 [Malus domestica]